jgi:putative copper resistance protein D
LDEPLVWVRIVHFAATICVTGSVLFLTLIAEPAFQKFDDGGRIPALIRPWLAWIQWISLALVVLSGAAWLMLKAAEMGDVSWRAVFSEDLVQTVLSGTVFGEDWIARSVLAAARDSAGCCSAGARLVSGCISCRLFSKR